MSEIDNCRFLLNEFQAFTNTLENRSPIKKMATVYIDKIQEEIRLAAVNPAYPSIENQRRIALEFKAMLAKIIQEETQMLLVAQQQSTEKREEIERKETQQLEYQREEILKMNQQYQQTELMKKISSIAALLNDEIKRLENRLKKLESQLDKIQELKKELITQIADLTKEINKNILALYQHSNNDKNISYALPVAGEDKVLNLNISLNTTLDILHNKIQEKITSRDFDTKNIHAYESEIIQDIVNKEITKQITKDYPELSREDRNQLIKNTIASSETKNLVHELMKNIQAEKNTHTATHEVLAEQSESLKQMNTALESIMKEEETLLTELDNIKSDLESKKNKLELLESRDLSVLDIPEISALANKENQEQQQNLDDDFDKLFDDVCDAVECFNNVKEPDHPAQNQNMEIAQDNRAAYANEEKEEVRSRMRQQ